MRMLHRMAGTAGLNEMNFDRFPVRDDQLVQDLHAVDLDAPVQRAIEREDKVYEKKKEEVLWKDEPNEK